MTRLMNRRTVDGVLDFLRYRLDTFPKMPYQPLPWLGRVNAARADGVYDRWSAIEKWIVGSDIKSVVDVGAQAGFFSISMAKRGCQVTAIERDPIFYRTLLYAKEVLGLRQMAIHIVDLQLETLQTIPAHDCTIFMSVWHHHCRSEGIDEAEKILSGLWNKTNKVMFFETGEAELPSDFNPPDFGANPDAWINDLLERTCKGSTITAIGKNPAFAPDGTRCERSLFAVERK